jgi:hypothetical protein
MKYELNYIVSETCSGTGWLILKIIYNTDNGIKFFPIKENQYGTRQITVQLLKKKNYKNNSGMTCWILKFTLFWIKLGLALHKAECTEFWLTVIHAYWSLLFL